MTNDDAKERLKLNESSVGYDPRIRIIEYSFWETKLCSSKQYDGHPSQLNYVSQICPFSLKFK
nr:hypothetical protein Itr_chr15CG10170 [Ipomoea trifida]